MSYNGGISFKGDKALAQEALPECLQCYNIVEALRTSAGLTELEKIFDLVGGGTCRVVLSDNVRHIYIDVEGVEPEEEGEEEELLEDRLHGFVLHDAAGSWEIAPEIETDVPPALIPVGPADDEWVISGPAALNDLTSEAYETPLDIQHALYWRDADALQLKSPTVYPSESKHALTWATTTEFIYWHDHLLYTAPADTTILGYGVHSGAGSLIILLADKTTGGHDDDPNPARGTVTVLAAPFGAPVPGPAGYTTLPVVGSAEEIDTFEQDWTTYRSSLEQDNYDEATYTSTFGTLWFNFAPDGSTAIRCRCLADVIEVTADIDRTEYYTYKEVLAFDYDPEGGDELADKWVVTRTIEDTGAVGGNSELGQPVYDNQPDINTDTGYITIGYAVYTDLGGVDTASSYNASSLAAAWAEISGAVDAYWAGHPDYDGGAPHYKLFTHTTYPDGANTYYYRVYYDYTSGAPGGSNFRVGVVPDILKERKLTEEIYFRREDYCRVVAGLRPIAYDYLADGSVAQASLRYYAAELNDFREQSGLETEWGYQGTGVGEYNDNDWFSLAENNPPITRIIDQVDIFSSITRADIVVDFVYEGVGSTDFELFRSSSNLVDDSGFGYTLHWGVTHVEDENIRVPIGRKMDYVMSDNVGPIVNRGGITAMDLRAGVFIHSDIQWDGSWRQDYKYGSGDNIVDQTASRTDKLIIVREDGTTTVAIPEIIGEASRPTYTDSTAYTSPFTSELGLFDAWGPIQRVAPPLHFYGMAYSVPYSRVVNPCDSMLAVSDDGSIAFQVLTKELGGNFFDAYPDYGDDYDLSSCGQSAYVYADEGFTRLTDILSVSVLSQNALIDDWGFNNEDLPAYAVCSTIAYAIIETEEEDES